MIRAATGVQRQCQLIWDDGRIGYVSVGKTAGQLPFYATVATGDVVHLQVDHTRLYAAMLAEALPYLAGEAEAPLAELLEIELAVVAAGAA